MADNGKQQHTEVIIPGRNALITDTVDTSSVAGLGISRRRTYGTFTNRNGLQHECIEDTYIIVPEDYDPVP
jgi:hypothetical protein